MEHCITFNKTNNSKNFIINPENPFLKITRIEIPSIPKGSKNISSLVPKFKITHNLIDSNKGSSGGTIHGVSSFITPEHIEAKFKVDYILAYSPNHTNVQLTFENLSEKDENVLVYYTQFDKKVDLQNPFEDFEAHFRLYDNVKILFSAPFGQGKTTFLNHFFETNESEFEVFKLYPVNYAVSHNEDIFKYIKAEILFQLMGKHVDFDKIKFDYLDTAIDYYKKNINEIISPLIRLLPKIGQTAGIVYDKIYSLKKTLDNHKSEIEKDDKSEALKFISDLYQKEGSIFEDNFYTQLIRQLLEQHKLMHEKQNVLIIDDIDRMDPEHIFRIFNVFSANFDSPGHLEGLTNKFSFDKIILVCDYSNIKKLFIHRYGSSAAFEGYLSKYFSKNPYYYNNSKAIEAITSQLTSINKKPVTSRVGEVLQMIINDLLATGELTLRDLLQLTKFDFYKTIDRQGNIYSNALGMHNNRVLYFNIIAFLENIFEKDVILEKIKRCRDKVQSRNRVNYNYYTTLGFIALTNVIPKSNDYEVINFKGQSYTFKTTHHSDHPLNYYFEEPLDISSVTSGNNISFSVKDFYDILSHNVVKYIEG